ncbi:MAG: ParB N-terminal domain-containing protein [Anaerolineae bacterium]|nr:ParB N-terminal domain-containing protein [Anaerolineae bacterium]
MNPDFPSLQILPVKSLAVHERHDDQRTPPLIERMRASGVLRNPPIVTPLQDGSDRYMVLDGANRTTAMQKMGIPHVLAQVVQPNDPGLELKTWNHVLWEFDADQFIQGIKNIGSISIKALKQSSDLERKWAADTLVKVQTPDGSSHSVSTTSDDFSTRIQTMHLVVDSYKDLAKMDRTLIHAVQDLNGLYDNLSGIVIFPPFLIEDVLALCAAGNLLPAGITRFTISPRALRVNYSLDELSSSKSIELKNETFERWMHERVARKGVRYYSEATVLFDE